MTVTSTATQAPNSTAPAAAEATSPQRSQAYLPHECEGDVASAESRRLLRQLASRRVAGIDVARAVALVGMMAVHLLSPENESGQRTATSLLATGNAAALFAVLAGIGVGLTTGRTVPPTGRRWAAAAVNLLVRTLYIGAVGLALGFVSADNALVILPYYALLFLMMIPIVRNPAWVNLVVGLGVAVVGPVVSHMLRSTSAPLNNVPNLTFADLLHAPGQTLTTLFLTGSFPAIGWFAYVCIGLGIGRMRLQARRTAVGLMVGGVSLAIAANVGSWVLLNLVGGRTALASVASQTMRFEEFTDTLVWGAAGTLPTDTWWWLAVLAPHTTTPFDLLYTTGVATAVLGGCLALGRVIPDLLRPIATFGSMPLSIYAGHLLLVSADAFRPTDEVVEYVLQLALLFAFALLWRRRFEKGPLEMVMGWFTDGAQRLVSPRPEPARQPA